MAISPVGDTAVSVVRDSAGRLDANFDSHNLPLGGEPVVHRGGVAFEPGTENTVELAPVKIGP